VNAVGHRTVRRMLSSKNEEQPKRGPVTGKEIANRENLLVHDRRRGGIGGKRKGEKSNQATVAN